MTITLTDEQAEFVRRRVECGKNASEQEVLDQARDALHADELEEEVGQDVVKAAIEEGTGQLRRGEGIRMTDRDAFVDGVMERAARLVDARKPVKAR